MTELIGNVHLMGFVKNTVCMFCQSSKVSTNNKWKPLPLHILQKNIFRIAILYVLKASLYILSFTVFFNDSLNKNLYLLTFFVHENISFLIHIFSGESNEQ